MVGCVWQAGRFEIGLDKPKIMGIVNLTPDSFSDGGAYSQNAQTALAHAERLLKEGADILDIGGESTRPEKALALGGIDIINDVTALTDEGAVELLARQTDTGICLMHMQGLPENMQINPKYQDVVGEVVRYLKARAAECIAAGIAPQRITLDPGFGFGKTLQHNIALMRHLPELMAETGFPLLIGVSRKRMIGELTGEANAAARVHGSVAAALASVARGAQIVRVHDVKATADALKAWEALGINL